MEKVIFIESKKDISSLKDFLDKKSTIILLNYDIEGILSESYPDYKTLDDYVNIDELLGLFDEVFKKMGGWYKIPAIENYLSEKYPDKCVNLGIVLNKFASDGYFLITNYTYAIDKIIKKESPDEIVCSDSINESEPMSLFQIATFFYSQQYKITRLGTKGCSNINVSKKGKSDLKTKLMNIASGISFILPNIHKKSVLLVGDFEKVKGVIKYLKSHYNVYFLSDKINLKQYFFLLSSGTKYLSRKGKNIFNSKSKKAKFTNADFLKIVRHNAQISHKGKNIAKLLSEYLSRRLDNLNVYLDKEINRADDLIGELGDLSVILLDEEVSINSRFLTLLANENDLNINVVTHGYINHSMGFLPSFCTNLFVWNEDQKKTIEDLGGDTGNIHVSGSLKYKDVAIRKDLFKGKRHNKKDLVILFAPTALNHRRAFNIWFYMKYFFLFIDCIEDMIERFNSKILLKFHPGDANYFRIRRILENKGLLGKVVILPRSDGVFKWLKKSDVIISMYSTVIVDSLFLNKPVINLGPPKYRIFDDLEKFKKGLVPTVETADELLAHIDLIANNKRAAMKKDEYLKFCTEFLNIYPEIPSKRIAQIILKQANKRKIEGCYGKIS